MLWSLIRRRASAIATTPVQAAETKAMGTVVIVATCPQTAAPSALPPMMAIW